MPKLPSGQLVGIDRSMYADLDSELSVHLRAALSEHYTQNISSPRDLLLACSVLILTDANANPPKFERTRFRVGQILEGVADWTDADVAALQQWLEGTPAVMAMAEEQFASVMSR